MRLDEVEENPIRTRRTALAPILVGHDGRMHECSQQESNAPSAAGGQGGWQLLQRLTAYGCPGRLPLC